MGVLIQYYFSKSIIIFRSCCFFKIPTIFIGSRGFPVNFTCIYYQRPKDVMKTEELFYLVTYASHDYLVKYNSYRRMYELLVEFLCLDGLGSV